MALTFDIGANERAAVRSVKNLGDALEATSDQLDDLAKDKGLTKLEGSFKDLARVADDTGDKVGTSMKDGFKKAGDGADNFKEEANSTAKETAASFDGSAESIAGAFQEIAANSFAGFGPAGALAGLAAAAGIGLVTAGFDAANEANEQSKQRVADWAQAYIDAGGTALTAGVQAAKFQEIITDTEKFAEAEKNAKNWGTSVETAVAAMSGNAGAIADVNYALIGQKDAAEAAASAAQKLSQESGGQLVNLTAQEQAYLDGASALSKLTGEMEQGQSRAQILTKYYEDLINSAGGATVQVDELGNSLYTLPDSTEVFVDAKTGQASQNVSNFKGDVDGIPDVVNSTVVFNVDDSAVRNYRPPKVYIDGYVVPRGVVQVN